MTRDEMRARCFEAIGDEFAEACDYDWIKINAAATAAFDALNGIALVIPSSAACFFEASFQGRPVVIDLTNPPEKKP